MEDSSSGKKTIGPCRFSADGWILSGPAAQRLFDKSAIGRPIANNELLLHPSEVLFCSRHRHLLIEDDWLNSELISNPQLFHETAALEAMRVPGEKIVLAHNVNDLLPDTIVSKGSWALRWNRSIKVNNNPPSSEVMWVRDFEPIKWDELYNWSSEVNALGRLAEVLIVDEEMGVTTYHISPENPSGAMENIDFTKISQHDKNLIKGNIKGAFLPNKFDLPEQIGTPLPEGSWIDVDELGIISNDSNKQGSISLLIDILSRKLLPRSGFKYGTRWRLYEVSIGEEHAPWLLQPEWLAPSDWAQACLAARLANGVHKTWLCAFLKNKNWCYVSLQRPAAEGRWSGFRHK